MNEKEKMISGKIYDPSIDGLPELSAKAHRLCNEYNATTEADLQRRAEILRELLPNAGEGIYLQGPFYCDFGENITIGKNLYANFHFTVLDCGKVEIGDDVFIGPNVSLLTPMHPFVPFQRRQHKKFDGTLYDHEWAKPIKIGSDCWIAGNVTIIGGVTIGDGCVIGAGSVVTHDIPAGSLAFGNPCKVIRQITDSDKIDEIID